MKAIEIDKELKTLIKNEIGEKYYPMEINSTIAKNVQGFGIYDSDKPKINNNRYYLEFNILKNNKNNNTLLTLMMNPSKTFPDGSIDRTVQNVIRIAKAIGCSKIVVLNTLPIINPIAKDAIKYCNKAKQENNTNFVQKYIQSCNKNNTIFLAAWGANKQINQYNEYISSIKQKFMPNNIFAYSINEESQTPAHPNGRGNNGKNAKRLQEILNGKKLIPIHINDDLTCSVK